MTGNRKGLSINDTSHGSYWRIWKEPFFCQETTKKKNNTRHILPPLRNNKGTHNKEGKSMDFKTDRKQEILNIIGNIKEKNDSSFQKSKMYEASFIDKKLISSHEFLNLIMIKKGYIS